MEKQQFSTFYIENYLFGVEVSCVQEVIRYQEMTKVPLAPPVISGLINLRGQIVTAIDLRRRLGLSDRSPEILPMNVVIRNEDNAISLLVDSIGDVLEVDSATFERPSEILNGVAQNLIQGIYKQKGKLLLVLDIQKTVHLG